MLDLLISREADLNAQTLTGETPLHYAVRLGREDMVQLMLQKGADHTTKSKTGKTAYDLAVDEKFVEISCRIRDSVEVIEWLKNHNLSSFIEPCIENDIYLFLLPEMNTEMMQRIAPELDAAPLLAEAASLAKQESGSQEDGKRRDKLLKQLAMRKQESHLRKHLHESARKRIITLKSSQHGSSEKIDLEPEKRILDSNVSRRDLIASDVNVSGLHTWEIDPADLEFTSSLGNGTSGEVFLGYVIDDLSH